MISVLMELQAPRHRDTFSATILVVESGHDDLEVANLVLYQETIVAVASLLVAFDHLVHEGVVAILDQLVRQKDASLEDVPCKVIAAVHL